MPAFILRRPRKASSSCWTAGVVAFFLFRIGDPINAHGRLVRLPWRNEQLRERLGLNDRHRSSSHRFIGKRRAGKPACPYLLRAGRPAHPGACPRPSSWHLRCSVHPDRRRCRMGVYTGLYPPLVEPAAPDSVTSSASLLPPSWIGNSLILVLRCRCIGCRRWPRPDRRSGWWTTNSAWKGLAGPLILPSITLMRVQPVTDHAAGSFAGDAQVMRTDYIRRCSPLVASAIPGNRAVNFGHALKNTHGPGDHRGWPATGH